MKTSPAHGVTLSPLFAVLLLFVSFALPAHASSLTDQVGMLDVTDYGAVADGVTNDTIAIQAAITDGITTDTTVYFPPGVYLINDTLDAMMIGTGNCGGENANTARLVGFASDDPFAPRSVLRLKNNLPAFQNPNDPKPLLWMRIKPPDYAGPNKEDCLYHGVVRDLDIDLGWNNTFAVGISFGSAQYSSLENVHVKANGAYAGFMAVPGANMANVNLSVNGGQYGFYLNSGSVGATLVGLTLTNQTNAGIYNRNYRGLTVVGLNFSTSSTSAAAIRTGGPSVFQGHIVLVDASLKLPTGTTQPAVENLGPRHVSLINTYVKGTATIVGGNTTTEQALSTGSPSSWTHVRNYACTPNSAGNLNGTSYLGRHVLDGVISGAGSVPATIKDTVIVYNVPNNLVSRHVWASTPSFTDADVFVLSPSGGDDTTAIQQALNNAASSSYPYTKVLLKEGTYTVGSTIQLRAGTVLMGIPGFGSIIKPSQAFVDSLNSVGGSTPRGWILSSPNTADADPVIMDLSVFAPNTTISGLGVLHWLSGRGTVRGLKPSNGAYNESHRRMIQIDGNGGGKWYAYSDHFSLPYSATTNSAFRKMFIGTTLANPLTFYGLNLERGGKTSTLPQAAFCEINNAGNVRIFGAKTESDGLFLDIRNNSHNIQITSLQAQLRSDITTSLIYLNPGSLDSAGSKIDIRNTEWVSGTSRIIDDSFTVNSTATRNDYIGVYRRGIFDASPWEALANLNPTVSITSPTSGTIVTALQTVTVTASAADADGSVALVEFGVNGTYAADDSTSPFQATVTFPAAGTYALTAVATDNSMNTGVSSSVAITVLPVPDISIPAASTAPVINGIIEPSWNSIPAKTLTHVVSGAVDNAADCAVTFRTQWDSTYLYLLVQVSDQSIHPQPFIRSLDRLELFIDANRDQLSSYGATDFRFHFDPAGTNIIIREQIHGSSTGASAAAVADAAGYVLEARIPWTTLQQSPSTAGATLGLDLVYNDNDTWNETSGRVGWFINTDTAGDSPAALALAKLAP